jgi:hypothetical protein
MRWQELADLTIESYDLGSSYVGPNFRTRPTGSTGTHSSAILLFLVSISWINKGPNGTFFPVGGMPSNSSMCVCARACHMN